MRTLKAIILTILSGLAIVPASTASPDPLPIRSLNAEPEAWPVGTWAKYQEKFLSSDGRIIDTANKNISHSEGQGYGMLLAVLANDPATFERIWAWTKRELYIRPDGLAAWKWEEAAKPNVTDRNNASDGDLLIAWALAEAADRWNKIGYREEAQRIAMAIDRINGARSPMGRVFMPGAEGFSEKDREDGPVVNLSYWIFPAIEKLRAITPNIDWVGYRSSGYMLAKAAKFGQANLPTDWISIKAGKVKPAEGFPPRFSYNAVRMPLYLAWVASPNLEALRPYVAFYEKFNQNVPEYDVALSQPVDQMGGAGYLSAFALAKCAFDGSPLPSGLRSVSLDQYYPTTLHMLSLAAARLRYSKCL